MEEKPPVVFFSFGDPKPWLSRAKDAGATVICQVQSLEEAVEAVDAGADVLQVQGSAAGGHTDHLNLLPFLSHVVYLYPDIPVMAAGGISTGRALAAVLAGGAEGASMGTAFVATPENVEVPDAFKQHII
jgi:nitronate monooxygenase